MEGNYLLLLRSPKFYVTKLLLADEPTGNLDPATGERVIDVLFDLNREHGTTLLLVTHDEVLARRCERRLLLANGALEAVA